METPKDRNDQLAEDLRALRPTPHRQFAEELDKRAAAGFPRRSRLPSFSLPRRPWMRMLIPAGGLAVIAIAIAGALFATNESEPEPAGSGTLGFLNAEAPSGDEVVSEDPKEMATTAEPAPEIEKYQRATKSAAGGSNALSFTGAGPPSAAADLQPIRPDSRSSLRKRAVERSARIVLAAEPGDVAEDSRQVFEAVHAHDGIVMRSSTREGKPGVAGARFELLIPSARLGDALAALSEIDEVRSRHEATADITAPTVNLGELLQDSKARIDSLLGQLEAAETESEREVVETELRQERRHRARLRSQLQQLQRRADLARISLRIETGAREDSSGGGAWSVDDALRDAGQILSVAAAVILVALAVIAPFVLIGLLVWLAQRAWIRRERRRVLS